LQGWGHHDALCRPGECVCGLDDLGTDPLSNELLPTAAVARDAARVRDEALARWPVPQGDVAALERLCMARFERLAADLRRDTDLYAA
jgi:hypothetical protein